MRGDLGLEKMKYRRHARALKGAGRVRAVNAKRCPKIVGEALVEHMVGRGTWADYVSLLMERYKLISKWKEVGWTKKEWDKTVMAATKEASEQSRAREVAGREDLEEYGENQKELHLAAYMKMGTAKYIREQIKERIERGKHWV